MVKELEGELSAKGLRLAVIAAKFTREITDKLLASAVETFVACGGDVSKNLTVARVPGSLELAVAARKFALSGRYDAVICLGCVIRGETSHYDAVVNGTTQGITAVSAQTGVPVIFGVLTCEDYKQAVARTDDKKKINTGSYAARAAIEMANLLKKIGKGSGFRVRGVAASRRPKPRRPQAASRKSQA